MNDKIRKMQDFCDVEKLSGILEKWTKGTGMEVVLFETKGVILEFGRIGICQRLQNTSDGEDKCRACWENAEEGIYRCHAGLYCFMIPITLPDGRVIAKFCAGGVALENSIVATQLDARETLEALEMNEEEVETLIENIAVKREEELEGCYEFLKEVLTEYVEKNYMVWSAQNDLRKEEESGQEMRSTLKNVGIGTWIVKESKRGKLKMYADHAMNVLLGCADNMNPEKRYQHWISRICPEYLSEIEDYQDEMVGEGHSEVIYAWNHPERGKIYIRCGGSVVSDDAYNRVMRGFHQDITERIEADRRNKEAMDAIHAFSSLYSGTWKVDVENDKVESIKPYYLNGSLINKHDGNATDTLHELIDLIVDEDCRDLLAGFEDCRRTAKKLKNRRSLSWEYRGTDGMWYRITAVPLQRNTEGAVAKILFGLQEITEEKDRKLEGQRKLEQANKMISMQLETISRAMPGGFKISRNDPDYTFKYVSTQLANMLGYTLDEFYEASGGSFTKIVNMEDIQRELPKALEMYSKGDTYAMKYRLRCKDGSWKYVMDRGRKVYQEDGSFENWCLILDIDEQERLNRMLQEERLQYRDALIQDCVYFYSFDVTDGYIREPYVLNTGEDPLEMMGISLPVMLDDLIATFLQSVSPIAMNVDEEYAFPNLKILRDAWAEGKRRCEYEYYDPRLEQYHRMVVLLSSRSEDGHILACVIGQDITEQKTRLEKAFADARRANKAKTVFLSRMSHDIRTPMNGILGMTKIAKACIDDEFRVVDALNKIETAGKQLEMLINDVLDMSRLESGKTELTREPFDIKEIVENALNAIRSLAGEKQVYISPIEYNVSHSRVVGSPLHTQRVLLNVLSNAIKYNKENGSLKISVRQERRDENISEFHFCVADTGIGMSKEFMKRMFEPFSREHTDAGTKYQGTGLGMPIMKELVDLMGGTIQVESVVDEGTTVYLMLPLELNFELDAPQVEEKPEDLEGMRILLVEDNQINMEIARFLLESAGATVVAVENGKRAVDYFSKTPEGDLDLILMDVMMPVMDGICATRLIRQSAHEDAKKIPIIAMTANAFVEDMKKTREAGMNAHLSKPLDPEKVMQVLCSYKKEKEQKDEA